MSKTSETISTPSLFESLRRRVSAGVIKILLTCFPNDPLLLARMGLFYMNLGNHDEAVRYLERSLDILPHDLYALRHKGRYKKTTAMYEKILRVQPKHFDALQLLGTIAKSSKDYRRAVELMDSAIEMVPRHAPSYANRGDALKELTQLDAALASYDKAIEIDAEYAEAYKNRGNALVALKQLDAALASYEKAIEINADYAEAYYNCGVVLRELKRLEPAVASYDKAIAIKADFAEAYNNRGIALTELKHLDAAAASCERAIAINPDYADAYANRGFIFKELLQLDAAVASYEKAIEIKADFASAHWNLSLCNLLRGNFERGWLGYEWRWKNEAVSSVIGKRNFLQPLWLGNESLNGKTILLFAEQGLGDALQFCRYAKSVAALGANVILEVQHPLVKLLGSLEGVSQIVARGDALPEFDYQCPLLSLPLAFRTKLATIPASQRYVVSNREKVAEWQIELGKRTKPRIGMVWSGSAGHKRDADRSLSLNQMAKLLSNDYQFISLQKEISETDAQILAEYNEIEHWGDELNDFADTAALCELMDVVISVDTSVAHLAGAIGKAVWVLLQFSPDWRWLLDRSDSPWYPSAKLCRQERIGDWDGVLEEVKADLAIFCATLR